MSEGLSNDAPLTLGSTAAAAGSKDGVRVDPAPAPQGETSQTETLEVPRPEPVPGPMSEPVAEHAPEPVLVQRSLTDLHGRGRKSRSTSGGGGFFSALFQLVFGLVLAVLVCVAIGLGLLIWKHPPAELQAKLEGRLSALVHRPVSIAGGLGLSVHPALGLEARDVTVRGVPGGKYPSLFFAKRLILAPDFERLLTGELAFKDVVLDHPVLTLETLADGRSNFDLPTQEPPQKAASLPGGLKLEAVDRVQIQDGSFVWAETGGRARSFKVDQIKVALRLHGLDNPLQLDGQGRWKDELVLGQLELGSPRLIMAHMAFPVRGAVRSAPLGARFDGLFDPSAETYVGQFAVRGGSLRAAAAWLGKPLPAGKGLGPFQIAGSLEASEQALKITKSEFVLDALRGAGDLQVALAGPRPAVTGKLVLSELDFTPYLPEVVQSSGRGVDITAPWAAQAYNLSALDGLLVSLDLTADKVRWRRIETGPAVLSLALTPGQADLTISRAELYGGVMAGKVHLAKEGNRLRVSPSLAMAGINLGAFLKDSVGFDRLSGTGSLRLAMTGAGRSQDELMRSLLGQAELKVGPGGLSGIDLLALSSQVNSGVSTSAYGPLARTRFLDLSSRFEIRQGLAKTQDFSASFDKALVRSKGQIDLGAQALDLSFSAWSRPTPGAKAQTLSPYPGSTPYRMHGPWRQVRFDVNVVDEVEVEVQRGLEALAKGAKSLGKHVSDLFQDDPAPRVAKRPG